MKLKIVTLIVIVSVLILSNPAKAAEPTPNPTQIISIGTSPDLDGTNNWDIVVVTAQGAIRLSRPGHQWAPQILPNGDFTFLSASDNLVGLESEVTLYYGEGSSLAVVPLTINAKHWAARSNLQHTLWAIMMVEPKQAGEGSSIMWVSNQGIVRYGYGFLDIAFDDWKLGWDKTGRYLMVGGVLKVTGNPATSNGSKLYIIDTQSGKIVEDWAEVPGVTFLVKPEDVKDINGITTHYDQPQQVSFCFEDRCHYVMTDIYGFNWRFQMEAEEF